VAKEVGNDRDQSIFNSTPFPTKPAHVLLPSTIRKQRSHQNTSSDFPWSHAASEVARDHESQTSSSTPSKRPTVRLKRSVKALRDLYEAQAEEASQSSTATSPALRPSSASSRLRSVSSVEGLSGRYIWEQLHKISSDDLAMLPSLSDGLRMVKRQSSQLSATDRSGFQATTSSPNYRILGVSSSPRIPVYTDYTDSTSPVPRLSDRATSSSTVPETSSSPNVIRLGQSSSDEYLPDYGSSSPNIVKLGTSSPLHFPTDQDVVFSPLSRSSSGSSSRKRKRSESLVERSYTARAGAINPLASSPPYHRRTIAASSTNAPTSPEERTGSSSLAQDTSPASQRVEESSQVFGDVESDEQDSDETSMRDTHASLQAVLSSSPPASIQYPVIRAPPPNQYAGIVVPKRQSRTIHVESSSGPSWPARLSAVLSEGSWTTISKSASKQSSLVEEDMDDFMDSESLAPAKEYIVNEGANQSQIRIVPEDHSHEATDELSALPGGDYPYRSPVLRPVRSAGHLGTFNPSQSRRDSLRTSIDARLNSMKSFTQSRHNSVRSSSARPSSSGSIVSNLAVPLWARRYYSGVYQDSFQYLYASAANVAVPARPETSRSKHSFASYKDSLTQHVPLLFRAKTRPRLEARKSHILPGVGPLVSHPVRPPATAALASRRQTYPAAQPTVRAVSMPLHPADPRAHWAGISEQYAKALESQKTRGSLHHVRSFSADVGSNNGSVIWSSQYQRLGQRHSLSPHLHQDNRPNTGSTVSRGYGFPFNQRPRWRGPDFPAGPSHGLLTANLRTAQVVCFVSGFLLPLGWFVGAFLPLPQRPTSFSEIDQRHTSDIGEREKMDVIAKLKLERQIKGAEELKWQNARWWRNLNRWMCMVGVMVIVVVIVLAVLGTKGHW